MRNNETMKKVAVVGAGPSGLVAMKSLKEEGIEPVCFERSNSYGGIWRYHDEDVEGLGSVIRNTVANTSKETGAFSDMPPPEDFPNFMHNKHVFQYLTAYAKEYDILRHILYNTEVMRRKKSKQDRNWGMTLKTSHLYPSLCEEIEDSTLCHIATYGHSKCYQIQMAEDYDFTGRFKVITKDLKTERIENNVYDGVLVCAGHHSFPNMPRFHGQETFKGDIIHTPSLKTVDGFAGKVVVVVGVGSSGMDAAVEVSSVAEQVYLSTRRGTWVFPRLGRNGLPLDLILFTRFGKILFDLLPLKVSSSALESMINARFDHSLYKLRPKHGVFSQHPTVSDSIHLKMSSGAVKLRGNVKEITERGVLFENEDEVTEVDSIILATGYKIYLPFLGEDLLSVKNNRAHLYKFMFPPHLPQGTLALIGLFQSFGPGFPLGEAQCRLASLVISGKVKLPSKQTMDNEIERYTKEMRERYVESDRHTIQVDYIAYMDDIYSMCGAKPDILKFLFADPKLFFALMFGPSLPYQYRLQGPHQWPGSRDAIMSSMRRVLKPLNENSCESPCTAYFLRSFFKTLF